MKTPSLETKLVHAGEPSPRILGAVVTPIFQSANFEYDGETSYHDLKYIRLNNTPTHVVLHNKLAATENAEAAVSTASGMAAISTALLSRAPAKSLGGVETLVTRPSLTAHAGMTPEERAAAGISDGLVRMSVGVEGSNDLAEDVRHALAAVS